jgi:hypothetical protein
MSISSIVGVGRVSASPSDTSAPATNGRQGADAPAPVAVDDYKAPTPPRFPWLSRLALQLEAAAEQKPAFKAAPVLGDHLDQSA